MFWTKVKNFFIKLWEWIKKIPVGVWVAMLFVAAIGYYLFRRYYLQKQIVDIQAERIHSKRVMDEAIDRLKEGEEAEIQKIVNEHAAEQEELDRREAEIVEATKQGPSAIVKEWRGYLKENS